MATVTDIEAIKRERKVVRSLFTRNANALEAIMADERIPICLEITIQYEKTKELQTQLSELDKLVRELLRNCETDDLEREMETATEYRSRWVTLDVTYKSRTTATTVKIENKEKRSFKLPTLQFITFSGYLKGWIPFWGQFQKIDLDPQIDQHDKYQYLLQAMKEGSEARNLVESFTPASYEDCLNQLKNRYAREDLLIQVYVRELLSMINKNSSSNLTNLYDKISAMLRALETLGVTKDKFAAFLLPMVESALPQELLKVWERNKKGNEDISMELNSLLLFVRKEIETEQRILLAKKSLVENENGLDTLKLHKQSEPTAGCLMTNTNNNKINSNKKLTCIWCDKDSHNSLECFKMQKMNMEERRTYLKNKKACAICLKKGHHPKSCKAAIKCVICQQRHSVVFCTGRTQRVCDSAPSNNLSATRPETSSAVGASEESISTNMSAGTKQSTITTTTLLQTVSVFIGKGEKQVKVRAMFDNGAQRSYVREDIARKLNISAVGNETLSHTLFGGVEISSKQYRLYDLDVTSLDKSFSFQLTALGQTCISRNIPTYTNENLTRLLTKHNITLSDKNTQSDDIGLLIGADFSGLVLTGDMVKLHDSLIAIKTKLGWTLQGKVKSEPRTHIQASHVAMFCSTDVSNFWSLESLGIRDPIESKTKQQNEEEALTMFEENVVVNAEGRYEVLLPWKVGHDKLLNNHDVATRRLQSVTNKLKAENTYEDYNKVFNEWHDKGIVEIVPDPKKDLESSHYLPHRPVFKEKSLTTRIRPVFDASAKDRYGTSNWADLASRGCDAAQLRSSHWPEGPPWLYSAPNEWPKSPLVMDEAEACRELKKSAICNTNTSSNEGLTSKLTYFSKYSKTIRSVAWMLRFAHNTRHKNKIRGELCYEEYEEAEKRLIKLIQTENRDYIEKKTEGLTSFYDKDSLLRIKTKLLLSDVPESTKFPAVLPATCCLTRRLVEQRHAQLQHAGVGTVLADLRTRYWIIGARNLIKSIIASCIICKRHRAKPIQAPTAPLPIERTQCNAPFEVTGVDLAGPLYLRGGERCWIVIYTCAVYRSIHLELTKSLSTNAFLMTLRRFIARRGRVNVIMSDNGTNFVGTKNILSEIDWDEVQWQSTIQRIKWKLNVATAAWWGGFWERLIQILKNLLKRVLGQSSVTYEELETILCDCENTINARPLTYIEDEKTSSLEPLKPIHFLQPISETDVTDIDMIDSKSLNKRLQYLQRLRENFRQRFKTEYLTTLVQRGREKQDSLKVGDVVLIETEGKRIKWPLGIIEEIFPGRDAISRTAKVRTSTGYKVRPFQRLFHLEVSDPPAELLEYKESAPGKVIPISDVREPDNEVLPSSASAPAVSPPVQSERTVLQERTTRSGRVAKLPSRYLI